MAGSYIHRNSRVYKWLLVCILLAITLYAGQHDLGQYLASQHSKTRPQVRQESQTKAQAISINRGMSQQFCREVTHFVFIKVPKTGSETVSAILTQFGLYRNLTFALPKGKGVSTFRALPIMKEEIMPIADGKQYDLLVHHASYNRDTIKEVFPEGTKIIGTVREPLRHFISAFYYFHGMKRKYLPQELKGVDNTTQQMEQIITNESYRVSLPNSTGMPGFNRQGKRLGVPCDMFLNATYVRRYIDSVLDKDFDLMLVQEYFDESLVLLKRRFCWSLEDIVYLSQNVNTSPRTDHVYTEDIINKHKKMALGEYLIYHHFYRRFWLDVWKEGHRFFEEVGVFKALLKRIQSFCARDPDDEEILVLPLSEWNRPFSLPGRRCRTMQFTAPKYAEIVREKQLSEILNKNGT